MQWSCRPFGEEEDGGSQERYLWEKRPLSHFPTTKLEAQHYQKLITLGMVTKFEAFTAKTEL